MNNVITQEAIQKAIASLKQPHAPREYYLTAAIYDQMAKLGMCLGGVTRLDAAQARSKD